MGERIRAIALLSAALAAGFQATTASAKGGGSVQCCPPGVDAASGRCLERLTRSDDPSAIAAACAGVQAAADPGQFSSLSGKPASCGDPSALGMQLDHAPGAGWWGLGPPVASTVTGPALYPSDLIAMGSEGCRDWSKSQDWQAARERCKATGYESVHVLVYPKSELGPHAEAGAQFRRYLNQYYREESWLKHANTKDRVFRIEFLDFNDLKEQLERLALSCKVIDRMTAIIHGHPGGLGSYGMDGKHNAPGLPVNEAFRKTISPCLFTPTAKLQFASCIVACGKVGGALRSGLEKIFTDRAYAPPGNPAPFEGLKLLFNTGLGHTQTIPARGFGKFRTATWSENDVSIEYAVSGGHVGMDVSPDKVPACALKDYPEPGPDELKRLAE